MARVTHATVRSATIITQCGKSMNRHKLLCVTIVKNHNSLETKHCERFRLRGHTGWRTEPQCLRVNPSAFFHKQQKRAQWAPMYWQGIFRFRKTPNEPIGQNFAKELQKRRSGVQNGPKQVENSPTTNTICCAFLRPGFSRTNRKVGRKKSE